MAPRYGGTIFALFLITLYVIALGVPTQALLDQKDVPNVVQLTPSLEGHRRLLVSKDIVLSSLSEDDSRVKSLRLQGSRTLTPVCFSAARLEDSFDHVRC